MEPDQNSFASHVAALLTELDPNNQLRRMQVDPVRLWHESTAREIARAFARSGLLTWQSSPNEWVTAARLVYADLQEGGSRIAFKLKPSGAILCFVDVPWHPAVVAAKENGRDVSIYRPIKEL